MLRIFDIWLDAKNVSLPVLLDFVFFKNEYDIHL